MALSSLDPLGRAGGVLPSADPSALEVAMDRNKQEDELAKGIQAIKAQEKAAAADNKQKDREAAAKRKTALSDKTLWFAHTLEGQKAYSNLINSRAKRFQDYEAGVGTDPYTEGTDAYTADEIEIQAWNQMVSNSDQLKLDHAKVKEYIMAHRDLYTDDALEKTDEEYANPEYLKNGELPNTLVAMIDLNKAIEAQFGLIEAEVKAWAENAADGGIVSGTRTQVLPESLRTQAEGMAAMNPNLSAKLGETMGNYTPEKQKAIKALAAANGISETAAVALDLATAKYGATQLTAGRSQANDGGSGAALAKGSLWFGKYLEDVMAGDYATEGGQTTIVGSDEEGYADIQAVEKDFPGWKGYTKEVPNNLRKDNTLKGFTWDDKVVYDPAAKTQVRTIRDIKKVAIDYEGKKFLVAVGPAGPGKANETVEVPFDQAESKLGPMILGHNKNLIAGQGGYDLAAEKTGEGTRKQAGAQNIVKTPTTAPQPKAETPKKKAY